MASSSRITSNSPPLTRGRACVSCRRRKMKCDGQRPICGQCLRANRVDDCEYNDGQGRTRTQMLEENITRLEARIQELENPEETAQSSVTLFDPYSQTSSRRADPSAASAASEVASPVPSNTFWLSERTSRDSHVAGSDSSSSSVLPLSASSSPQFFLNERSGSVGPSAAWWTLSEPPFRILQQLIDIFLGHSTEFGFFLNVPRFRNAALLPLPFGHHHRPSPAILSVVYLFGICLSRSENLLAQEQVFLSRGLHETSRALAGDHPQKILHSIQAEVLLANYFFSKGRLLEGKYHCSAAIALVTSCGLHKLHSDRLPPPSFDMFTTEAELPPARDQIEEGERIGAMWSVFSLDKSWSAVLGSPSVGLRSSDIDTPWPLDMDSYEQSFMNPDERGHSTLQRFIRSPVVASPPGDNAAYVQASFLFERSTELASRWSPSMDQRATNAYVTDFLALDGFITRFIAVLPVLHQNLAAGNRRSLLVTHTLARASTIQLHRSLSYSDVASNGRCLEAASAVVGLMELQDSPIINPTMGILWLSVCLVFIKEISRLRNHRTAWVAGPAPRDEAPYTASLSRAMTLLATFAQNSPLVGYQFYRVQEAYAAL